MNKQPNEFANKKKVTAATAELLRELANFVEKNGILHISDVGCIARSLRSLIDTHRVHESNDPFDSPSIAFDDGIDGVYRWSELNAFVEAQLTRKLKVTH